jgi:hypothetical protein
MNDLVRAEPRSRLMLVRSFRSAFAGCQTGPASHVLRMADRLPVAAHLERKGAEPRATSGLAVCGQTYGR